ncbi:hypothetical protein QBC34DRAFT_455322 [Podospora aff. communis PSN243]|uniref:TLDc domain-containing protein n=1 Tax=Podospora aff. communis PSN243 TaxID=3040156 RepID=A0AAV9GW31_9PEZI|nr:hypothetical protein QBC34DRAFT_455322 [Podospora aff. communis PSN243]
MPLPCDDWEYQMVDRLVAQGKLSPEFVMKQLDNTIQNLFEIGPQAKYELNRVFDLAANQDLLTETALLTVLQAKTAIKLSPKLVEANEMIFSAIRCLADLPFGPNNRPRRDGITLPQVYRALAWILPDHARHIFVEDNFSRVRTLADHRRLIFQGFASRHGSPFYEASIARKLAARNAFDCHDRIEHVADLCAMNYDDGGDEIFHDLLEILYSSQDQMLNPCIAPATKDAFRPLANEMSTEHDLPTLRTLAIPSNCFVALVRLLLAMQFPPPAAGEDPTELSHFTSAAVSICAAFTATDTPHLITHPPFDHGLHKLAPYLFDSLYRFLSVTFLGQNNLVDIPRPSREVPSRPSSDGILTLPLAAQLATFLSWNVDYTSLTCHARFKPEDAPENVSALLKALIPPSGFEPPSILLLQGFSAATSEPVVFGFFTPSPDKDGKAIQDVSPPNYIGVENCALFQLAPVHEVFRGTVGKAGWSVADDKTIVFGDVGAGASVTVTLATPSALSAKDHATGGEEGKKRSLGRVTAQQVVVSGEEEDPDETRGWDREDGWFEKVKARKEREKQGWTFEADERRGDLMVEFEVELVEVWSGRQE